MEPVDKKAAEIYEKQHSFEAFQSKDPLLIAKQTSRAVELVSRPFKDSKLAQLGGVDNVLGAVKTDLQNQGRFRVTAFIAEELATIEDADVPRYLYHRYRYDVYPLDKKVDEYPPYLQIEPSSICNFKCVFCYQTDPTYNSKTSGHLGTMTADMFKKIVDQIDGKVEFISLASRGEPLVAKELPQMLEYTRGKFLGLKINTNASLLTEKLAHSILSSGVKTIVFSADAAEEPLYSKLRVNGNLERTVKNIDMFDSIRRTHYSQSKVITRVSGVRVSELQSMDKMVDFWGSRVNQVAFVKYNPWENIYKAEPNNLLTPCSDLWRRMFIWYDGAANPCDSDYKSTLAVGNVNTSTVGELWQGKGYESLREDHLKAKRQNVEPCKRCFVI